MVRGAAGSPATKARNVLDAARLSTPPHLVAELPSGNASTLRTLKAMRFLVRRCKTDLALRNLALQIVRPLAQRDYAAEIRALHAWVRDRIRYVRDIAGVETVHTPRQIVEQGQGDCDDKALLLATLLESIGHKTRFAALGYGKTPTHVLVEANLGEGWIPLETTEPVDAGWYPDGIKSRITIHN